MDKTGIIAPLKKQIVMFGMLNSEVNEAVNWIAINIKHYTYNVNTRNKTIHINDIKHILQIFFQIERYIYFKNCEYDTVGKMVESF